MGQSSATANASVNNECSKNLEPTAGSGVPQAQASNINTSHTEDIKCWMTEN